MSDHGSNLSATERATPGAPQSAADKVKTVFAARGYELLGELGRGGMGVVYLALEKKLNRKVALKTVAPDRVGAKNSMKRFEREAQVFAKIRHANIATLYDFDDEAPIPYLALEYIEGTDLETERRNGRKWTPKEVARIIGTLASALEHTHALDVSHRDIKPGNVLIEKTGRVVLTDFGLAKAKQDETLTAAGFAVGTPAYMAPEQISDQYGIKPDERADIFALGTLAYEMLTNKHPFLPKSNDDLTTMRNIVGLAPPPLRDVDPAIPEPFAKLVHWMLVKEPLKRIQKAKEVASMLDEFSKSGTIASLDRPAEKAAPSQAADDKPVARAVAPAPPKPVAASAPVAAAPAPSSSRSRSAPVPAGMKTSTIIIVLVAVGFAMLAVGLAIGLLFKSG